MSGAGTLWAALAQGVIAGLLLGLCLMHALWSANGPRRPGSRWLMAWSADLSALFFINALLAASGDTHHIGLLLFLRSQALAVAVLLAIPSIKDFIGGTSFRAVLTICSAAYVVRAVLWLTTDLIVVHGHAVDGYPIYGPLVALTFLAPLGVVVGYAAVSILRVPPSTARTMVAVTGVASISVLLASYVVASAAAAELLTSMWTLPLVVLLHAMAIHTVWLRQTTEKRLARIRQDQVTLNNAVWFQREPQAMLAQAEQLARELLKDDALSGTIRRLARGNHVVGLYPGSGVELDEIDTGYLDALARIVTAAADQHAMAADMRHAAMTDPLTNLPNRPALEAHLRAALTSAAVANSRLAVIFCDIDDFKKVNDEHGHPRGDAILVEAAGRFQEIVGDEAYVARFGGDEFVVVLTDAGPDDALIELAGHLRRALLPQASGGEAGPSLSVGVALWTPGEENDPYRLLRDADTAMYGAKGNRDGVLLFAPSLREHLLAEIEASHALSCGVADGEIEAHFQPVVDAATREVRSHEALARWRHAGQLRMPDSWLPLAEKSGLILEVGLEILRQARRFSDSTGLPVAVNIAPRQLMEPGFVAGVVDAWGEDAWDRLVLEITESALVDDVSTAEDVLSQLRTLGARVALDDFGTGYSSISLLGGLPIDILKIDRAFVTEVLTARGQAVVRAILALADAYDLEVIAEGVELDVELEALNLLGPMQIQGYLTGRAAPATVDLEAEEASA